MNFLASKQQLRASFIRWALFCVPLIVLLGFLAGQLGGPQTAWFQSLEKPAIYPPPAAFGIVWSVLYVMIGISLALVISAWGAHERGLAIAAFALHFLGNLAWTPVFFGMQDMQLGLWVLIFVVVSLLGVIALFWKIRRLAGLLLLPYLAWAIFATALNYQFIAENPDGGARDAGSGAVERIEL